MSLPSVLIRKSTGEIIKHTVYPRPDMQAIEGLDPDLEYLLKYQPYEAPEYDSRIFILNQIDAITTEAHPVHSHLNVYKTTFSTVKRTNTEILESIKQAQRLADEGVFRSQEQMTSTTKMISILDRKAQGLTLTVEENAELDKLRSMRVKIDKNQANYNLLKGQLEAGQEPNIDSGWESAL